MRARESSEQRPVLANTCDALRVDCKRKGMATDRQNRSITLKPEDQGGADRTGPLPFQSAIHVPQQFGGRRYELRGGPHRMADQRSESGRLHALSGYVAHSDQPAVRLLPHVVEVTAHLSACVRGDIDARELVSRDLR